MYRTHTSGSRPTDSKANTWPSRSTLRLIGDNNCHASLRFASARGVLAWFGLHLTGLVSDLLDILVVVERERYEVID